MTSAMRHQSTNEYLTKPAEYFQNPRTDILPLLPNFSENVLELGCGTGATLAWLKSTHRCENTYGIELFPEAAETAARQVDHIVPGDIEKMALDLPARHFDLILCLDVLEHLIDPWRVLQRLVTHLKPGGTMIASIPNIRNWRALFPLLFNGSWNYTNAGILDKTHLRFFTRQSAIALVEGSGLHITHVKRLPLDSTTKGKIANAATLTLLKEFLTLQYLIAAKKQ